VKRSDFVQQMAFGAVAVSAFQNQVLAAPTLKNTASSDFYLGSYTATPEQGITRGWLDPEKGDLQILGSTGADNPSFLIYGPNRKFVYAVNETDNFGGTKSGSVSAFGIDKKTGNLSFLNVQPSLGAHPCHLSMDRTGKYILVANYTGGNVAVLPILKDGRLGEPVEMVQHTGHGPNTGRQEGPHAHSVNLSPDNRFAFVCDLGIDKIMIYRFDESTGKLSAAGTPFFKTAPGAGPRHFTFSRNGKLAFVVNELNSTITSMKYDSASGVLTESETRSTLPPGFTGENTCADVHVHPNGQFLYASNRGHDSIAAFSVEPDSGKLALVQHQSTLGKTPRNFAIHSSGKYLLAANQNSDSIHLFKLDPVSGKLTETRKSIEITKPVCILL